MYINKSTYYVIQNTYKSKKVIENRVKRSFKEFDYAETLRAKNPHIKDIDYLRIYVSI